MVERDKVRITVQDFERILAHPANQDRLLELIDGEIIEKMPTLEHGVIVSNIVTELNLYRRKHKTGFVATEARHSIPEDEENDLLPDASYTKIEGSPINKGSVPQMPELAVEVKSPTDKPAKLEKKASYYMEHGTQLVWLVYPDTQQVVQLTKDANDNIQRQIFTIEDTLDGGSVLPGFTLPVKIIFDF